MVNLERYGALIEVSEDEISAEAAKLTAWVAKSVDPADPKSVDRAVSTMMFMVAKTVVQRGKLVNLLADSNSVLAEHHMDRCNLDILNGYTSTSLAKRTAMALSGSGLPDEPIEEPKPRQLIIT